MILLTDEDGKIIGKFMSTVTAFQNCYAMAQINPGSQVWGLDVLPQDKQILTHEPTEWMVVKIDKTEPVENWIRPIAQARSVMHQKHTSNTNSPRITYRMFKPVSLTKLLRVVQFPGVKTMATEKITRYPRIRL
ncbi:hypothetical protein UFOVP448_26 [uncultured Caudovirales phage]|uniref:Uncharacterized protein n=1 Tax=uncultured Caudovirales phage TaxID=2100421 RepID=A0A6J5M8Y1_9CAUD|nr:hypothetical protein UFOVP448_26 [uncultured Caudovirales phage]